VVRDERGRLVSGTINPGGRPKALVEVVRLAREATVEAIGELRRLATSAENESARVAACNALLDRGWGKAPQTITIDETPNIPAATSAKIDMSKLSDDELRAYEMLARALARIRAEGQEP
jgi:hypothetical protein